MNRKNIQGCNCCDCGYSPISICPKFEGCPGTDLSGGVFSFFGPDGTLLGQCTSDATGSCPSCFTLTKPVSSLRISLAPPVIYVAPSDITLGALACGAVSSPDFGTLSLKTNYSCCCGPETGDPLPPTLTATVNGHEVTLTQLTLGSIGYTGCLTVSAVEVLLPGPGNPLIPGSCDIITGAGSVGVSVGFSGCDSMGASWLDGTAGGGSGDDFGPLPYACVHTPTTDNPCPGNATTGNGVIGTVTVSCPFFATLTVTGLGIPPGDPSWGGGSTGTFADWGFVHGNPYWMLWGQADFTMTVSI